jgi:hypothetical protein
MSDSFMKPCSGHTGKCPLCGQEGDIDTYSPDKQVYCCKGCRVNHEYRNKFTNWGKWDESITSKESGS